MIARVKIDLDAWVKTGKPLAIELGSGGKLISGRICIDQVDMPNVDIVADLEDGLHFLPSDSVDELYASSVLEHIENLAGLMREITRVLKRNGKAFIYVPHFSNPHQFSDYTHVRYFGLYTFYYFVERQDQLKRKVPAHYTDIRIRIHSLRLTFTSEFRIPRLLLKVVRRLVNSSTWAQEFYEAHLCYLVPCDGIYVVFGKPNSASGGLTAT